jgi:neurofibromin 1
MTAPIPLPRSALGFHPTPRTLISSSLPLHNLVGQWAGHIVYLLSAVNWGVVMNKIKTKIHALARATPTEENLDSTDLMLLQHCAMDRKRLVQVLSELSSLGVNMKRDAQAAVAISLRRAIWNWMETFPHEYQEVIEGTRKLDGAPERVFDLLYVSVDEGNKKIMWPMLTALMVLSYDRSKQLAMSYSRERTKSSKKVNRDCASAWMEWLMGGD